MKRRGVRESDPFDWEKAGSDSTQSEGLGTAVKSTAPQTNKVIITDNVEQQVAVDNQENVEPDNMKEVSPEFRPGAECTNRLIRSPC